MREELEMNIEQNTKYIKHALTKKAYLENLIKESNEVLSQASDENKPALQHAIKSLQERLEYYIKDINSAPEKIKHQKNEILWIDTKVSQFETQINDYITKLNKLERTSSIDDSYSYSDSYSYTYSDSDYLTYSDSDDWSDKSDSEKQPIEQYETPLKDFTPDNDQPSESEKDLLTSGRLKHKIKKLKAINQSLNREIEHLRTAHITFSNDYVIAINKCVHYSDLFNQELKNATTDSKKAELNKKLLKLESVLEQLREKSSMFSEEDFRRNIEKKIAFREKHIQDNKNLIEQYEAQLEDFEEDFTQDNSQSSESVLAPSELKHTINKLKHYNRSLKKDIRDLERSSFDSQAKIHDEIISTCNFDLTQCQKQLNFTKDDNKRAELKKRITELTSTLEQLKEQKEVDERLFYKSIALQISSKKKSIEENNMRIEQCEAQLKDLEQSDNQQSK